MKKYKISIKDIIEDAEKRNKEKNQSEKDLLNRVSNKLENGDYSDLSNTIQESVDRAIEGVRSGISNIFKNYGTIKKIPPAKRNDLVMQKPSQNAFGVLLRVLGLSSLSISIISAIGGFLEGSFDVSLIAIIIGGLSFLVDRLGSRLLKQMTRYQKYIRIFGDSTVSTVEDLALGAGVEPEIALKDLKAFIKKDYFKEARLVEDESILVLDNETFKIYKNDYKNKFPKKDEAKELIDDYDRVKETINLGKSYVTEITELVDKISEPLNGKVRNLLAIVKSIFNNLKKNPGKADELNKFMDYYLPTTVSLLKRYEELSLIYEPGDNAQNAMEEIEKSIDTINGAFKKLLNELYGDVAMEVNTDISVLKMMLKQEGLLEDDFK